MNLTDRILAAAWRENLNGHRTGPAPAPEGPFNQLDYDWADRAAGPAPAAADRDDDPVKALEAVIAGPVPAHLAAELESARTGRALAHERAAGRRRRVAALAARTGAPTLAALIAACGSDVDTTARLLETLATDGHQLHPCARTRLGWNRTDLERYDLETPAPIRVRLVADRDGVLDRSGADFRDHPVLAGLDLPDPVVPVHPWQLEHRVLPRYADLFAAGRLAVLDETVPAWPTAAIRTLAGHRAPGFLKLALGIHITSTRRDISPATALLAPVLSGHLTALDADGTHRLLPDLAGAWLPGRRDLTAIARAPLAAVTPAGAVCVPATALAAASPVTGASLAAEYADWHGDPGAWLRAYAALFVPPVLAKAAMGIGLEAHLQNSLVAMDGPVPVAAVSRDLGGARLHLPTVPFDVDLPAGSPVRAHSIDQVRAKVAYTLFQNHLAALVTALERDTGLDAAGFWADLADLVAGLDLPAADRDCYLAPTMPTKALLSMRLEPGREIEALVDNPLARP
ncbi:IucA/IucC family protein [Glycomyces albidus]|uniref:RhbF-like rhizobactin siderophore biosynthesis protein n=1 Tax=Glycomyces albidus TaxID=2656774 RepID=A0A6L5GGR5_9ACTN|nr:IucA/IucC family protein [Glycomyces albidus]MQM28897.1 RhbF-like rhizobactin siderophore biosynthesis protein [Glycomyces albidus]